MQGTINWLIGHFVHEYEYSDGAHQKPARQQVMEPLHTAEDVAFTTQEIQAVLEKFDTCTAHGEDALNSEILPYNFRSYPTFYHRDLQ
jgi:hypothetical protein